MIYNFDLAYNIEYEQNVDTNAPLQLNYFIFEY